MLSNEVIRSMFNPNEGSDHKTLFKVAQVLLYVSTFVNGFQAATRWAGLECEMLSLFDDLRPNRATVFRRLTDLLERPVCLESCNISALIELRCYHRIRKTLDCSRENQGRPNQGS